MIITFADKYTEAAFEGECPKKWLAFRKQLEKKLHILHNAITLDDLRGLPSNRFKSLNGNRYGQYSISINMQWRICFEWIDGEAFEVEIVDYHH